MKTKIEIEIETKNIKSFSAEDDEGGVYDYDEKTAEEEMHAFIRDLICDALEPEAIDDAMEYAGGAYDYFGMVEADGGMEIYGDTIIRVRPGRLEESEIVYDSTKVKRAEQSEEMTR